MSKHILPLSSSEIISACFSSKEIVNNLLLEAYRERQETTGQISIQFSDSKIKIYEEISERLNNSQS